MRIRLLARLTLAAAAIVMLGACVTIPERARANGQAMSNSRAYRQAMSGDMSLTTQTKLRTAANPVRLNHRELPYAPFSQWW
jgi:hypothetical protein